MTTTEEAVLRNVIARLRCAPRPDGSQGEADHVREALRGDAAIYLDTWVTPALELLLPEKRDPKLALALSRR